MAEQESGGTDFENNDALNAGGAFQLRSASNHDNPGDYTDTQAGYDANLRDALLTLTDDYNHAKSTTEGGFVWNDISNHSGADHTIMVRMLIYYNAGFSWWNTYGNTSLNNSAVNSRDPNLSVNEDYIYKVGAKLGDSVPQDIGVSDPALADALQYGQRTVDCQVAYSYFHCP